MKKTSTTIFLIMNVFLLSPAVAGEESHRQAAEKLLRMAGMERALEQSIEQMLKVQLQQQPSLGPYKEVMLKFLKKHMSFESLKGDIATIYMEEFTEPELNEIMAFYETPTGRKTLEKMPRLMMKGAQLGITRVQQNIVELQEMIKAESERIKKLQDADKKN
jgi:hypothetical protein